MSTFGDMVKATDLRIGNFVLWQNRVTQLKNFTELFNVCDQKENTEPIPLSEEWFERFSFKEEINSEFVKYWTNDFITIYHEYYRNPQLFIYSSYTELKYVHQLQNLFFALTGQELTLSEKATAQ